MLVLAVVWSLVLAGWLVSPAEAAVTVDDSPEPSWQVNGRAYATVVVGDTVFLGGAFTEAVSPTGQTAPRAHLAAFSLSTGDLLDWRADTNSTVRALVSDGTSLFAGGNFGRVGGRAHRRLAKIDVATGAVDGRFIPDLDGAVRALDVADGAVYVGGGFSSVNGRPHAYVAKVDAGTGEPDEAFQAHPDSEVWGIRKNPVTEVVYVSGKFRQLNGTARNGVGALSSATGATTGLVFGSAARPTLGLDINEDGTRLFGAGGSGSNAAAAWSTTTGVRVWRQVTDGDIQAITYQRGTVYFGFHDGYQGQAAIKLLAADAESGALDADFQPRFNDFWGVYALDATDAGVVVGGDFTRVSGVPVGNWARFLPSGEAPPPSTVARYAGATTTWRYWDQGTRPTGWSEPGFDDSAWPGGLPQLGYGDGDEATPIQGAAQRNITAYFRSDFTVSELPDSATLQLLADDGAVVYVNGQEVVRDNMPDGPVTNTTLAASNRSGGPENAMRAFDLPVSALHAGTNAIAVEVHQDRASSSDLSFDLDLSGESVGEAAAPNQDPTASFTATMSGMTGHFDGTGSSDPEGGALAYAWDFGDGTQGTGATADHPYTETGQHTVTLTVTDPSGATGTASRTVDAVAPTAEPTSSVVVDEGSTWRWRYDAGAPPADWALPSFDDSGWLTGLAPLGFGTPGPITTDIDSFQDPTDRPVTAYFRHTFQISDVGSATALQLSTVADDGVVVYVNGVEVGRGNMRDGQVTSTTYAPSTVGTAEANADPLVLDVPVGLLDEGTNVVTAETHVNYRRTRNLSFKLEATLTRQD